MKQDGNTAAAPDVLEGWMLRSDLAAQLGFQEDTLRKMAAERRGPPFMKLGHRVYYNRESVRSWLLERQLLTPRNGRAA